MIICPLAVNASSAVLSLSARLGSILSRLFFVSKYVERIRHRCLPAMRSSDTGLSRELELKGPQARADVLPVLRGARIEVEAPSGSIRVAADGCVDFLGAVLAELCFESLAVRLDS